jgi:hypothetical protein
VASDRSLYTREVLLLFVTLDSRLSSSAADNCECERVDGRGQEYGGVPGKGLRMVNPTDVAE